MLFCLNFLLLVTSITGFVLPIHDQPIKTNSAEIDLVDYINSVQSLFVAENSNISDTEMRFKAMDLNFIQLQPNPEDSSRMEGSILSTLPTHFDSRVNWPNCNSMKLIRDQTTCGSCWAFSTAEIISDRTCIKSKGKEQPIISPEDILTCCGAQCNDKCKGGYPMKALEFWNKNGVVTGGDYQGAGCKPYSYAPCSTCSEATTTPTCSKTCQNGFGSKYSKDKYYGSSAYTISNNVAAIQTEIYKNGPVVAGYTLYEDFYKYKSGIYHHVAGKMIGGHAVKIIGWGTENNVDYWIIANSWATGWGENGFFRMRRGTNECGIEAGVMAGQPKVSSSSVSARSLCLLVSLLIFYSLQ